LPQGVRPYLVELRHQLPPGYIFPDNNLTFQHSCGGSLIGRQTVLTAARKFIQEHILFLFNIHFFISIPCQYHLPDCFTDDDEFILDDEGNLTKSNPNFGNFDNYVNQVDIGRYELDDDTGVTSFQICPKEYGIGCDKNTTAYVVRKQDYDPRKPNPAAGVITDNDFALIFLPQPITDIDPVELNDDQNIPANAGDDLVAIGWGFTIPDSVGVPSDSDLPSPTDPKL